MSNTVEHLHDLANRETVPRFSKTATTGMRVPRNTHAPVTFPGTLSTVAHRDQSSALANPLN
jgi:hypothetical protein